MSSDSRHSYDSETDESASDLDSHSDASDESDEDQDRPPLPMLPPEDWRKIRLFVLGEPWSHPWPWRVPNYRKRDLLRFAQACKEFLVLSLPVIYRHANMPHPMYQEMAIARFTRDKLRTGKHLHVRYFSVQLDIKSPDLDVILSLCKNIQEIDLGYEKSALFNSCIRRLKKKAPPSLTRLRLGLTLQGGLSALEQKPAVTFPRAFARFGFTSQTTAL